MFLILEAAYDDKSTFTAQSKTFQKFFFIRSTIILTYTIIHNMYFLVKLQEEKRTRHGTNKPTSCSFPRLMLASTPQN